MIKKSTPPHSKDSEMMVLGCMLVNTNDLNIAVDALVEADFYHTEHQGIFSVLKAAHRSGKPADIHLIGEELKRRDKLDAVGGIPYLTTLAQFVGTSAYIEEYVQMVREQSILRRVITKAQKMQQEALEGPKDIATFAARYAADIREIADESQTSIEGTFIAEILSGEKMHQISFIERIGQRKSFFDETGQPFLSGLQTGFKDLDELATILLDTNLVVVGARPGMGKTSFALAIVSNIAEAQTFSIAIISLEMNSDQLTEKFLSMKTRIAGDKIQRGLLSNEEMVSLRAADCQLRDAKILFYDEECHTVEHVISLARKAKEKHGIRLLVIDYLQLLGSDEVKDSRQYEVAYISRKLKLLATELKIPIVCLSQLSREVERRQCHLPIMSDLRDSGQVEQDADAILFLHRDEYYDPKGLSHTAKIILAKNRHGPTGNVTLHFEKACGVFSNGTLREEMKDLFGE